MYDLSHRFIEIGGLKVLMLKWVMLCIHSGRSFGRSTRLLKTYLTYFLWDIFLFLFLFFFLFFWRTILDILVICFQRRESMTLQFSMLGQSHMVGNILHIPRYVRLLFCFVFIYILLLAGF